jgi:dihydroorotate dehydrogenase electron transfer subunit
MTHLKPTYDPRLNRPFMTKIEKIQDESPHVKSFYVNYNPLSTPVEIHPGQFVMVWVPGLDEIPMSVSRIGPDFLISISVAEVGEATQKLHSLNVGDYIGIRGPYGSWYQINRGDAIIVGGGIGMASLLPLVEEISQRKQGDPDAPPHRLVIIEGAKTEHELLFLDQLSNAVEEGCQLEYCTDDGSTGFKGFTTEKLEEILEAELNNEEFQDSKKPITVYACGPEIMLYKIFQLCEKKRISLQVSMERMMRCGFGICGLCALEPTGLLVCRDGPVFNMEALKGFTEFGKIKREFSGKLRPL